MLMELNQNRIKKFEIPILKNLTKDFMCQLSLIVKEQHYCSDDYIIKEFNEVDYSIEENNLYLISKGEIEMNIENCLIFLDYREVFLK